MAKILKQHEKKEIERLSLEMQTDAIETSRILAKKYDVTPNTIRKYMHSKYQTNANKRVTDEEVIEIKQAYKDHESSDHYEKIRTIAFKFNRSECTVRNVLTMDNKKAEPSLLESKIKYFDPKVFQF